MDQACFDIQLWIIQLISVRKREILLGGCKYIQSLSYLLVPVVTIYFLNSRVNCGFFVYLIYKSTYASNYKSGKNHSGSSKLICASGRGVPFVTVTYHCVRLRVIISTNSSPTRVIPLFAFLQQWHNNFNS